MTLKEFWEGKSDRELELATRQIAEYTEEAQQVIRAEAEKRGIPTSPAFTRSTAQREPNLLGSLLEKSRLDGLDTNVSHSFLRKTLGTVGKIARLTFLLFCVALLLALGRFIFAFIIIGVLLYDVYRAIAYRNCYLILHEQGVVYEQPNEKRVAYYDELKIWQEIKQFYGRKFEQYTLQFPDGERVSTFQESIGKKLQMMVTQHQLPKVLEAYHQGNDVLFDSAICLNKKAISVNGETIKWSDVHHVDIVRGNIYIYGNRVTVTNIPVSVIPNVYVFLNLLERLGYINVAAQSNKM